ncbi:MAG: succinylglutamate desuccinylase/aspartoacylase family protein [Wenzhouxiangella sp.]
MKKSTSVRRKRNTPITIGGIEVHPGERRSIEMEVARLYTHTPATMPVQVVCGERDGPVLFVSAAIHGDELNGVEIIRRLLKARAMSKLRGTLIAVPIVNMHGFIHTSRYLPDRRDLNRSFPGSETGSLAARIANLLMREIVNQSTHGIDLHTGAVHRANLPQIRANLDDPVTRAMAGAFAAPVVLNAAIRDGSLRAAAMTSNIPILLYEAGEALRLDEMSIRGGVEGIIRVMRMLGMLQRSRRKETPAPVIARSSSWVRASQSGIFRSFASLGEAVTRDETILGVVADPFGEQEQEIRAPFDGIVIGRLHLPLVNEGDAIYHIARFDCNDLAAERIGDYQETLEGDDHPHTDSAQGS